MHNKTTPDAAAEAIKTLMHALIDISVIADRHISTPPAKQNMPVLSFLTHWLSCNLVLIRR